MALLCLLLMAAFYLAVIIGQPQEDETASTVTPRMDQPLLSAGQDVVTITSADDLPLLLRMFPAPALTPIKRQFFAGLKVNPWFNMRDKEGGL